LSSRNDDSYRYGSLPDNAPLAAAYVPIQKAAYPAYDTSDAFSKGTLFPGLNLPFMNIVSKDVKLTPRTELMAIDFVIDELELYLDTHKDDREAFDLYQSMLALGKEAHRRYVELFGPVAQSDMLSSNNYSWLENPWPWDFQEKKEA
jgi:spore coat protein JB